MNSRMKTIYLCLIKKTCSFPELADRNSDVYPKSIKKF